MKIINKNQLGAALFAILCGLSMNVQAAQSEQSAGASDSAISESVYSLILSTAAVMDELVAKASEVCDSRSGNLSPDWVADKLVQVKTRAAAIDKIFDSIGRTTQHFQPCSRENGVSAYMKVLSIDPFLDYVVREARSWGQTYNSGLPACRVRDNYLKDWKVETDGAVEYATQYRSGVRTPLENCAPAKSSKKE